MPNWCANTLELAHEDPAMIERARVAFNDGRLCNEFAPVPEDLHITAGCVGGPEDQAQKDLVAQEEVNKAKFGYANWYDYCVAEWGTKWDVGGDGMIADLLEDGRLAMTFDSAWSPPLEFYGKMCDLGFEVRAYYYESGMCFAGVWEDGCDDFYDLSDCRDAQEVEDTLPTVLDEMFCISEYMREYEAENEEEEELHTWVTEGAEAKKAASE
jgi:hypothetical protein